MAASSYATTTDLGIYLRDVNTSANSTAWTALLDRASRFIDSQTGQFFYQKGSASYLLSGNGQREIFPNFPIVSVSLLEIAYYTSAPFNTVAAGQYFLNPDNPQDGYPYTSIQLSNIPSQGQAVQFYHGIQNVRLTCVAGWPSIPSDIVHLTLKIAARAWKARDAGFSGVVGSIDTGMVTVKQLDTEDRMILNAYRRPSAGGDH